jgi:hypothetical protein
VFDLHQAGLAVFMLNVGIRKIVDTDQVKGFYIVKMGRVVRAL